ncbi:MAG: membrane protein insertase YidC [Nitrospiraceae bacterium]|nr:MAG: membrane protein insertase YidC [Nitrospiraceae bacterium]
MPSVPSRRLRSGAAGSLTSHRMEKRIILFLVLSMAVIVLYPYLLEKMGIAKRPVPASKAAPAPALPQPAQTVVQVPPPANASAPIPVRALVGEREQEVTVETDLVKVILSNRGGVIKRWELKRYLNTDPKQPQPIQLVPTDGKGVSLIPPLTVEVPDARLQERMAKGLYVVSGKDLSLSEGQPAGEIGFSYTDPETGAQVTKRLTFHHGSYLVDLTVETSGVSSSTTLSLGTNFGIHEWQEGFVGFIGPATHIADKLDKATPEKEDLRPGPMKWAAMQDKYFLAAAIPADAVPHIGVVRKEGERLVSVGLRTPAVPGTVASRYRLFVGPKEYDTLAALKIELEETIDFGWFIYGSWSFVRAVAKPVFYAIRYLHDLTHNYGVAIIIVTIGIKLLLAPLAYKSYKSMKDMAAVQPELMALQKKYADDRERLNKELIKLYKDKKVNPVGGCLPMFFQIPIFVALFNILYMTIELRQAPFMLWVKDLSVQDPYYVLPILMGVTMFIQQKIQPTTMDPKQAQIMLLLPVFLTFLFVTFPAGLVLYWLTNNVLTITQQVVTDRYLLPKTRAAATAPAAK